VLSDPNKLIAAFVDFAQTNHLLRLAAAGGTHERLLAPHEPPLLPNGKCAVYVFSRAHIPARAGEKMGSLVLKVGKAGPNSQPRFRYQHYSPGSSDSNLAKSILQNKHCWPRLGIDSLDEMTVGVWLKSNTDRDHFLLDASNEPLLESLENFLQVRLNPMFEG
jgi:hypothetical protein